MPIVSPGSKGAGALTVDKVKFPFIGQIPEWIIDN